MFVNENQGSVFIVVLYTIQSNRIPIESQSSNSKSNIMMNIGGGQRKRQYHQRQLDYAVGYAGAVLEESTSTHPLLGSDEKRRKIITHGGGIEYSSAASLSLSTAASAAPPAISHHKYNTDENLLTDVDNGEYFKLPIVRQCLKEIRDYSTTPATILSITIDGVVVTAGEYAIRYLANMRRKRADKSRKDGDDGDGDSDGD